MVAQHSEQGKAVKNPLILLSGVSRQKGEIKLPLNWTQTHDLDLHSTDGLSEPLVLEAYLTHPNKPSPC